MWPLMCFQCLQTNGRDATRSYRQTSDTEIGECHLILWHQSTRRPFANTNVWPTNQYIPTWNLSLNRLHLINLTSTLSESIPACFDSDSSITADWSCIWLVIQQQMYLRLCVSGELPVYSLHLQAKKTEALHPFHIRPVAHSFMRDFHFQHFSE